MNPKVITCSVNYEANDINTTLGLRRENDSYVGPLYKKRSKKNIRIT